LSKRSIGRSYAGKVPVPWWRCRSGLGLLKKGCGPGSFRRRDALRPVSTDDRAGMRARDS